ncbi:MAG: TRAP transporter small permease subunit [Rhizobiaceae bacterium]
MNRFQRIAARILQLPLVLASLCLFLLMILTFADVIMRSAFSAPIEAATELTRIAMAIIVFSALPVVSANAQHISVDLLDRFLDSLGISRLLDAVVTLACGVLLVFPASRTVDLAERARSYGDLTEYLSIPTFYIGWFIAIMTFVTALVMIMRGLILLVRPEILKDLNA